MNLHVSVVTVAALSPAQARTLSMLASASCPSRFKAKAAVLIGATDLAAVLGAGAVSAFWTVEAGCVDEFLGAPALRFYIAKTVPVIALVERLDDARAVQAALGQGGTA